MWEVRRGRLGEGSVKARGDGGGEGRMAVVREGVVGMKEGFNEALKH